MAGHRRCLADPGSTSSGGFPRPRPAHRKRESATHPRFSSGRASPALPWPGGWLGVRDPAADRQDHDRASCRTTPPTCWPSTTFLDLVVRHDRSLRPRPSNCRWSWCCSTSPALVSGRRMPRLGGARHGDRHHRLRRGRHPPPVTLSPWVPCWPRPDRRAVTSWRWASAFFNDGPPQAPVGAGPTPTSPWDPDEASTLSHVPESRSSAEPYQDRTGEPRRRRLRRRPPGPGPPHPLHGSGTTRGYEPGPAGSDRGPRRDQRDHPLFVNPTAGRGPVVRAAAQPRPPTRLPGGPATASVPSSAEDAADALARAPAGGGRRHRGAGRSRR